MVVLSFSWFSLSSMGISLTENTIVVPLSDHITHAGDLAHD
jgi:hypothetical protein